MIRRQGGLHGRGDPRFSHSDREGQGARRRAYIEHFPEPVRYGVHGGIKKFYGVEPVEELPTTLDHIVAAVAG
jgi:hypothetical protein